MRRLLPIPMCLLVALLLGTSSGSSPSPCRGATTELAGLYPDHALSPQQSLRAFDTVFFAEVIVPSRSCSLGTCVGMRVLKKIKGRPNGTVLLRLAPSTSAMKTCADAPFAAKGSRWVVFANQGTSRRGQSYFDAGEDGPSFAAVVAPDFDQLEARYRMVRSRLDQAISDGLEQRR